MGHDYQIKHRYFYHFENESIPELKSLTKKGFDFTWDIQTLPTTEVVGYVYEGSIFGVIEYESLYEEQYNLVYKLEVIPSHRNEGIGATLLAYVAKDAFDKGFEGFILVTSKSTTMDYYISKLGGTQLGRTSRVIFDTIASQKLIDRYLSKEDV